MSFLAYLVDNGYSGQQISRKFYEIGRSSDPKSRIFTGTGSQKTSLPPTTRLSDAARTKFNIRSFRLNYSHCAPNVEFLMLSCANVCFLLDARMWYGGSVIIASKNGFYFSGI